MRYFDAFSGYGGFSLGIQRAYGDYLRGRDGEPEKRNGETDSSLKGVEATKTDTQRQGDSPSHLKLRNIREVSCIGFSEIDKYASKVYSKHFPTHKPYGDITKIDASTLPDFDLFVGGFPCQAFSTAGKRGGFEDTRGTLIYDVLRIVKEKHPRLVLLENVKGLLSHDGGRTFKTIITALAELGYAVEWQVLNAKNFGVPQNRERVFIIGHLGGFGGRAVFPLGGDDRENTESNERRKTAVFPTIRATHYKSGDNQPVVAIPVLTPDRIEKRQNGRRFKEDGEPSFTLTGQDKHGVYDGTKIRRLTPIECERLMGLPDDWTEGVSDTQRYKLCGNGVVVNVVEETIKRLASLIH